MTQQLLRVDSLAEVQERRPTYLALGSFDGVHIGHQAIIRRMVQEARSSGARTAVLTFFPHPKRVLTGQQGRYYINSIEDRVRLLAGLGVDLVITHPFDEQVRNTRAATFVDQLVGYLDMRQIWGGNFSFGYRREGDVAFLRREGARRGFEVRTVNSMLTFEDEIVSSSRVRRSLREGDISDVTGCLGRRHSLQGVVVQGDKRGRTIGFPTANLALWDELLLPANGVYATMATLGDREFMAAANVGVRPTVDGSERTVEAHLLDFDEEIYGQPLRLAFVQRIRPERRFAGLAELQAQITRDVTEVRRLLLLSPDA